MSAPGRLKGGGYLVSIVSVVLLGIPAWESASKDPPLLACLIGGVFLSILGMALRWRSFQVEQREKGE